MITIKTTSAIEVMSNPYLFVQNWLKNQSISITENGYLHDPSGRKRDHIEKALWLDYLEQIRPIKALASKKARDDKSYIREIAQLAEKGAYEAVEKLKKEKTSSDRVSYPIQLSQKELFAALDVLIGDTRLAALKSLKTRLACTGENLDPIRNFVTAVTGQTRDIDVMAMSHFLWQIKRKIFGMPVRDHLMVIVYGGQGVGKSIAVERLLSVISSYTLNIEVTALNNPSGYRILGENYAAVFDELQGAKRADVDALKRLTTATTTDSRTLHTQNNEKNLQNCAFIGTTNKPVNLNFFDTTGMRRFYELKSTFTDRKTLNSIDYLALWQGIDENRETLYIDSVREELKQAQEQLVSKDEILIFLEEKNWIPNEHDEVTVYAASRVFEEFQLWAGLNGFQPINSVLFGKRLTALNSLEKFRKGNGYFYKIRNSETPKIKIVPNPTQPLIKKDTL